MNVKQAKRILDRFADECDLILDLGNPEEDGPEVVIVFNKKRIGSLPMAIRRSGRGMME